MEFRILGPLQVAGAVRVDLTGHRERALLARLLLSANQVVSSERLIEDVWEDAPPENALRALPVYISRLRKALRGGGLDDVVVTCAPGYVLRLAPGDLDAARFEAQVARGRDQVAAGNAEDASTVLREALALWRGPALADVADMSFARAEAARLEESRLSALEDRIDADLASGRHSGLIGELAALVSAHPLRERLWGQRMLALYRAGRQAEALRAYQELRATLVEELGIEPTLALSRLEAAILRHDDYLEWRPIRPPLPSAPVHTTVPQPEPPAELSVPLPHFLTDVGRIFVGRDPEVGRLDQLWKEATAGERRVALLAGEPGVGKTRLAAEVARRAHRGGAVVLAGRCEEDLGVPYQPFVEALRHFTDQVPSGHLRRCLGRYGGELARLVPELVEQVPGLPAPLHSDPETERYRLFDAVAAWLAAASAEAPLVVVLDDLQWAARPTLLLLRHVIHSAEPMRLLVLGTYRDSELAHDHPLIELIADLHRQGRMQRIALSGLDDPAVAAFVEQASRRRELDEDGVALAHAIYAETDGNPFFVREVLRHLSETGAVEERADGWVTCRPIEEVGIPEGVRDVIGRRLSHLSKDANRMLRVAAVMGTEFDPRVLETADVVNEEDLLSALEEATAARLVVEVAGAAPRYRFAHALVRDTLYAGLSAARRTTLHRRVAEAIEAVHSGGLYDHLPALAHHWGRAAAPAPEIDKAVDYAAQAGDRALAQLANDEAVAYYRQALDLLDAAGTPADDGRRLEIAIALGEAQRRAGDPAHRETLLEAARIARQRGDAVGLARAALAKNRGYHGLPGRVDAEWVAATEAALAMLPPEDSPWRARLLANLANELSWAPGEERRFTAAAEALAMARRLGDAATLAHVLGIRVAALPPSDPARLKNEVDELEMLVGELNDPTLAYWAAAWRAMTALVVGDRSRFDAATDRAVERAEQLGQPFLIWSARMLASFRLMLAGRLRDAEVAAEATFEIGRAAGIPDAGLVLGSQRLWIHYEQGRLDEVIEPLSRAIARPEPDPFTGPMLAMMLAELGRIEETRSLVEPWAAEGFRGLSDNYGAPYALTLAAAASARIGHHERSSILYDRLLPYRGLVAHIGPAGSGCVDHFLGMLATSLGRFDDADGHFREATAVYLGLEVPTWLARTRLEWARMFLTRRQPGDAERASDLLDRALATARQLGLGNVERSAVELLRSR